MCGRGREDFQRGSVGIEVDLTAHVLGDSDTHLAQPGTHVLYRRHQIVNCRVFHNGVLLP
jgi:hypothetical protein